MDCIEYLYNFSTVRLPYHESVIFSSKMSTPIKVVGVVGTGVIGASWTGLFLANGLRVLVSDPAPGAEEKLAAHLEKIWPTLELLGLAEGASISNYRFVGPSLQGHYGDVDFIQEVVLSHPSPRITRLYETERARKARSQEQVNRRNRRERPRDCCDSFIIVRHPVVAIYKGLP